MRSPGRERRIFGWFRTSGVLQVRMVGFFLSSFSCGGYAKRGNKVVVQHHDGVYVTESGFQWFLNPLVWYSDI